MVNNEDYRLGTIVQLRKPHPSGTLTWEVIRLGADIKIKSTLENSLFIMMPRSAFNRRVKKIINF